VRAQGKIPPVTYTFITIAVMIGFIIAAIILGQE
jgi:hypothetical protein